MSKEMEEGGEKTSLLDNLSERERKLAGVMVLNFVVLIIALGVYLFNKSLTETEAEIAQYNKTLDALGEYGPVYLKNQQKAEQSEGSEEQRFSGNALRGNKLQLTSFVATQASAVDIKVDNYDEDSLKLTTKDTDGPLITEQQLRVDIREAQMDKVMQLLDRIEKSTEPVIIKRINLRQVRKKKGVVRANITISTYTQAEQEG